MTYITEKTLRELQKAGYKARIVSVSYLPDLKEDIDELHRQGLLDKQLSRDYLQFEYNVSTILPPARSLFVIAIPQPITRAKFEWQGKTYDADIPPTYIGETDDAKVKDLLTSVLRPAGYKLERAKLPVKTLAVRSGLAQYGRNNITYVPGIGSFHRLVAFYSDYPIEVDNWQELKKMKSCENCFKCLENCPTQCITPDRFLIHAENCLTWQNERERNFPTWVKPDWHNSLIGCMRCQLICPVNKAQIKKVVDGPQFSEDETVSILNKKPLNTLSDETRQKLIEISADNWYEVLTRNLKALMRNSPQGVSI